MACGCENTREIFPNCDMSRWEVQCSSYIEDADNYYTKPQIDEMLEEIESAITSGCCITPEEVDEKIDEAVSGKQDTLSAGTNIIISGNVISAEVPSLSGYATEQWVLDKHYITGVDLSDYATQDWVLNQNYMTNSELIQYITNLQNQIDSLKEQVSGCCGTTGETYTRWITMTGDNDYVCSGTTKYSKEKEQTSTDGYNWTDTGNYRIGSTVLEVNSYDCTYCNRLSAYTANGDLIIPNHKNESEGALTWRTTNQGNMATNSTAITSVTIASCVTKIGESAGHMVFGAWGGSSYNYNNLVSITIPSGVTRLYSECIYLCPSLTSVTCLAPTPPTMESHVFGGTPIANGNGVIYVPAASVDAYKAANRWSAYASIIQAIPNS